MSTKKAGAVGQTKEEIEAYTEDIMSAQAARDIAGLEKWQREMREMRDRMGAKEWLRRAWMTVSMREKEGPR